MNGVQWADIALSLVTLTVLEVVLGVDNLVILAILSQRVVKAKQKLARRLGLTLAWVMRLVLLFSAVWLTKLTSPLFTLFNIAFSGRDLFLIGGGVFLLAKASQEIHAEVENETMKDERPIKQQAFFWVVIQIVMFDLVFSLDSVLTAVGITQIFWVMAVAITIAILAMICASEPLTRFIEKYPTIKMLALSFLILIGMALVADGFEFHIPRGYLYFAMSFSFFVEFLNHLRRRGDTK